jgi:hypothetical protein
MLTPIEMTVGGNEASDLLPVHSTRLLTALGARRAFWTVLDEGPVEDCLALLVEGEDGGWQGRQVRTDAGPEDGRTEDGEALAYTDGWVYVVGSHFGSKGGPLRPRRAFFARFREDDAVATARGRRVPLRVVRNQFRLHRALNDAFADAAIRPLKPGERVHDRFIVETLARGAGGAKTWLARLAHGDVPCNVEAAAFNPAGNLLIGLRFPVTEAGEPILVEIADVSGMFDADPQTWPTVVTAYALTGVTPEGALTGFRALHARPDGSYDAVIGSIDATGKGSILLDDHPMGGDVTSRHVRFRLPESGHEAVGETVEDLAPFRNVEGLTELDGQRYFVTDEDHRIALWIG